MNLKELYNPKRVYEGYFDLYFIRPFIHHYSDFKGKEGQGSVWRAFGVWLLLTLGVAGILMGQVGLLGPESGFVLLIITGVLWIGAWIVPLSALFTRGARGSEGPSIKAKLLGIDILLGLSCVLFFVLGLLMMLTTLNSGNLNPNAGATDEVTETVSEEEYVKEEPIFTYQDEAPVEETPDTMADLSEPDLATPEESFDPTLVEDEVPVEQDTTLFY